MNTLLVVEDEKLIRQGIVAMIRRSSVPVEEILEAEAAMPGLAELEEKAAAEVERIAVRQNEPVELL